MSYSPVCKDSSKAGRTAQVVERKREVLSSNPSTFKKKKTLLFSSLLNGVLINLCFFPKNNNNNNSPGTQWLTPVIPATQEAEIRRIEVPSQPRQIL
jgi:hypothetical protein